MNGMHTRKVIYIIIGIGFLLSTVLRAAESKADTFFVSRFASDLRYIPEMQARAADSIYLPENNVTTIPDRDSLLARCAEIGYEAMEDEMQRYYGTIDMPASDEKRLEELRQMRRTVERIGGSILQRELEYAAVIALPDNTPEKLERKSAALYALVDKCVARKDVAMEMRVLSYLYIKMYLKEQYYDAFLCAGRIVDRLRMIPDTDYPEAEKKNLWYNIGRIYYDFRDYEHAVPYLKAALSDKPVPRFYNMYNLQARNVLGLYYREIGQLDSSDYYFRSMLESRDRVRMRPMLDCIALSNLATNYRRRGLYREALELHKGALPASLAEGDHSFTSGIYVGLADCCLETGDLPGCKAMIDSALYHIGQWEWVMSYRSCDLYPVMARYYARLGDQQRSIAYMDSTTLANRRQDDKFSALMILRANQEMFGLERARKEMQLDAFRRVSVIVGTIAVVIFITLLVISVLYRRKHRAYRHLAALTREWAEKAAAVVTPAEADTTDLALMESIQKLFDEERLFLDPDFDLETLSQRLNVHRNQVSKAINTVYDKPFSTLINECRVRHAIHLLSDPANDCLSLEAIGFDAGFASRPTFYRVFKAQTGISPATYRKNRG